MTDHTDHADHGEFNQTDSMIERDRVLRATIAILAPFCVLLFGYLLGGSLADFFELPVGIGKTAGLVFGAFGAIWTMSKSYITNSALMAFVTVDPFATLLKSENTLVTYGPGFHFCYPWEQRDGGNTVNLSEAAESFDIKIQGPTGSFTIDYSTRLRPDIRRLPEFLAGVASVAADLRDLISAEILTEMSGKHVDDALVHIPILNQKLKEKFKQGPAHAQDVTGFEGRFGVIIGDVTAGKILPSDDVSETMSSLTESAVIDQIVANSFGYSSAKEVREAVKAGEISDGEVNRRRNQTMAMSGNLQGMDLKEQTYNLRLEGVDNPELIKAIVALAPAITAALASTKNATAGARATPKPRAKSTTKPKVKS